MNAPTIPAPCYRCVGADIAGTGPIDGLCHACRGEVQANRDDARDEIVMVVTRGGMNRPDVRLHPLTVDPWGAA